MSTRKRAESAQSSSSNEFIDRQLNELIEDSKVGRSNAVHKEKKPAEGVEGDDLENVAVMVRCRPLVIKIGEKTSQPSDDVQEVVKVDEENSCIEVSDRQFFFDQVFGPNCDNEQVYMRAARRLVDFAFQGYNCTIFLYGQTGTGKTYTHSSLTLAAFEHLFSLIQDSSEARRFLIRASYYELYNEEIRDLLAPKGANKTSPSLELRESKEQGVYVKDLTCFLVNNLAELKRLKQLGDKRRTTASTRMNEHSSRSHSIFAITIETVSTEDKFGNDELRRAAAKSGARSRPSASLKKPSIRVGRLNLIDLAGSERQSKSGATGVALKEASRINLSLTCLSLVIRALTDGTDETSGHIPYRNSKLTRLLSSSLGGNSKTILIACLSMALSNLDETLNTLRFASRTKQIKNKAVINEDPKDALLRKYRKQLEELRVKLDKHQRAASTVVQKSADAPDRSDAARRGESELEKSDDEALRLNKQLELLKAKIIVGGENLIDKLELHERLLEASKVELEERRRQEAKLRERLQDKKQTIEQVVLSKGSLDSQLEYLDAKLDKAVELYKSSKLELRDLAKEHEQLREQLLQTIKSTSKEIKYVDCIIDDFIPREHLNLINAYAQYDDESDEWQIKYIALSGNNIAQTRRLVDLSSVFRTTDPEVGHAVRRDRKKSTGLASSRANKKSLNATNNRIDPFIRLQQLVDDK